MPDDILPIRRRVYHLKPRPIENKIEKAYIRWLRVKRDVAVALKAGAIIESEWQAGLGNLNEFLWGERRADRSDT